MAVNPAFRRFCVEGFRQFEARKLQNKITEVLASQIGPGFEPQNILTGLFVICSAWEAEMGGSLGSQPSWFENHW